MRFFVALEIPEESKKQLQLVQSHLKQLIPQARLSDNTKLHLTIAFIGEQPEDLKEKLVHVLNKSALGVPTFEVTPAWLDGFPSLHNPHTFWVGVNGDIDKLLIIRERIKDGLIELKLPIDPRRYTPHIAICKINDGFNLTPKIESGLEKLMEAKFDPIRINSIKLFESVPEYGFHKHNTLAEVKLV